MGRVLALAINVAVLVYLVWAKRLFGIGDRVGEDDDLVEAFVEGSEASTEVSSLDGAPVLAAVARCSSPSGGGAVCPAATHRATEEHHIDGNQQCQGGGCHQPPGRPVRCDREVGCPGVGDDVLGDPR